MFMREFREDTQLIWIDDWNQVTRNQKLVRSNSRKIFESYCNFYFMKNTLRVSLAIESI